MCLLIQQPASTEFSDEFLTSVYMRNSDGIGVMWAEAGVLKYHKHLPTSLSDAIKFYRDTAQGKDCCVHFRMKTHGDIDMTNCHPYPVLGFDGTEVDNPMLLMHNGVLFNGNAKDKTKSDTWHFINDYLRPLVSANPDIAYTAEFVELLGKAIGSTNKFAIMDGFGRTTIVNKSAGVEYEGAWLSNTYAWDYSGLHPNAPKFTAYQYGTYYGKKATPAPKAAGKPAHPQLPLLDSTETTKGGGKRSKKTSTGRTGHGKISNVVSLTHASEVQEVMDLIGTINADMYEAITFRQVENVLRTNDYRDPWDLLDLWEVGHVSDEDFLAVFKGSKTCVAVLDETLDKWRGGNVKTESKVVAQ